MLKEPGRKEPGQGTGTDLFFVRNRDGFIFCLLKANDRAKSYPDRYPVNSDSIGIELVGKHIDSKRYETVTSTQNTSLQWLLGELYNHFSLTSSDIYKHPEVSYKHPGEASTATWK